MEEAPGRPQEAPGTLMEAHDKPYCALHMAKKVCKNKKKSHIFGVHGTRRGKIAYDRSSRPKIAPKHESLIKYEGFWGSERALQVPGRFRGAQDRPFGGLLGPRGAS